MFSLTTRSWWRAVCGRCATRVNTRLALLFQIVTAVRPGDALIIDVELTKMRGKIGKAKGQCKVQDEVVSEAEVTFVLREP